MKNPIQMIKECVENDEPYFVLRGKDICALAAVDAYYTEVCKKVDNRPFLEEVLEIMNDFKAYQEEEKTHVPD